MTDRTVLEHLLEGRDALLAEVKRLNSAIAELDTVITRISGSSGAIGVDGVEGLEDAVAATAPPARRAPARATARKSPAKKAAARKAVAAPRAETGGKSIREHVLEMLGAENREYGLTEIIERIHSLGIQAHDDAVRSITIKLMKDGQVERVGRGQYRLSSWGSAPAGAAQPAGDAPSSDYVPPLNFDNDPES